MKLLLFSLVIFLTIIGEIAGHGMMLQPPNRSSRWRFDSSAPINYDDNGNNCGGFHTQYALNGGKCGVCGDRYDNPHPQDNENSGKYGNGVVVAAYKPGSIIETEVRITANHLGYFTFDLCKLEDPEQPEPGEDCFEPLFLVNDDWKVDVHADEWYFVDLVQLPNTTCDRCVLRWTYRGGNNWGICDDNQQRVGCGPQEHFRGCADISIL